MEKTVANMASNLAHTGGAISQAATPLWLRYGTQSLLNHLWVSGNYASGGGGGTYVSAASPNLHNLAVGGNQTGGAGGGLQITKNANPALVNVLTSGNRSTGYGVGIYTIAGNAQS